MRHSSPILSHRHTDLMLSFLAPFSLPCRKRHAYKVKRMTTSLKNVVLVDMDNTLVNWDLEFGKRWIERRPTDTLDVITNRKHFELEQNFARELQPIATSIMSEPGFYASLQPQPGAIEAVREMTACGLHVLFCTAPTPFQYESCVAEKFGWVRQWLGDEYLSRLIVTRDKSVVRGCVLVDDKPKVAGICDKPDWTHVVFEQPYNVHVLDRPRMKAWSQWRGVLSQFFDI